MRLATIDAPSSKSNTPSPHDLNSPKRRRPVLPRAFQPLPDRSTPPFSSLSTINKRRDAFNYRYLVFVLNPSSPESLIARLRYWAILQLLKAQVLSLQTCRIHHLYPQRLHLYLPQNHDNYTIHRQGAQSLAMFKPLSCRQSPLQILCLPPP